MKSRQVFVIAGGIAMGLLSPMAMAMTMFDDDTNCYFNTNRPLSARGVILEGAQRSTVLEGANSTSTVIEKSFSAPVVIERANAAPVVVEDRIVKKKHFFAIGIWPMFDFEVL